MAKIENRQKVVRQKGSRGEDGVEGRQERENEKNDESKVVRQGRARRWKTEVKGVR